MYARIRAAPVSRTGRLSGCSLWALGPTRQPVVVAPYYSAARDTIWRAPSRPAQTSTLLSPLRRNASNMALTRSNDPLVWIDCEMTGLDPTTDTILSISCLITDADLNPPDPHGFDAVIHHTQAQLSAMNEWCVRTHGASGLTRQCLESTTTPSTAAADLLAYIQTHVPTPRVALLAGNSIHADRAFLAHAPWHAVLQHLHYRLFDVSSTKEMVRRWAPEGVLARAPHKQLRHTAAEDVRESIEEARYYMGLLKNLGEPAAGGTN